MEKGKKNTARFTPFKIRIAENGQPYVIFMNRNNKVLYDTEPFEGGIDAAVNNCQAVFDACVELGTRPFDKNFIDWSGSIINENDEGFKKIKL